MNLPNKLIIFRIALIPFFLFFFLTAQPGDSVFRLIAMVIFVLAAFSDFLDGYLARKWDMTTNFGKLMDPMADKMLVCSALVALVQRHELAAWVVIIIICREFWVTALRILALEQGREIISASKLGKVKTVLQMGMLACLLAGVGSGAYGIFVHEWWGIVANVLVILTVIATVFSAVEYTWGHRAIVRV